MKHNGGWKRSSTNYLYESKWFNLRQDNVMLPTGEAIVYTYVEHPGYSLIVPLLDNNELLLERVYRYTVQETVLECPSGGLDGDSPKQAAMRELLEETGFKADSLIPLGSYFGSNGISDERFYIFLGLNLEQICGPQREPTEQIALERLPLNKAVDMANSGEIVDGPSALGILLTSAYLKNAT